MRSFNFFSILISLSAAALFTAAQSQASDLGRQLFEGGGKTGVSVTLESAGLTADAAQFPCAKCHGSAGLGTREASSAAPPLLPSLQFGKGPPEIAIRAQMLRQAVVHGKSLSGEKLSAIMPRYDLPADAEYQLLSFLDTLEARQRSGVSASSVRFGVLVPDQPSPAELALLDALSRAASKANDGNPIHGRSVEVVRLDTSSVQDPTDVENIFGILAVSTRTAHLVPLLDAAAVPVLFPLAEVAGDGAKTSVVAPRHDWITAVINDAKSRGLREFVTLDGSAIAEGEIGAGLRAATSFSPGRLTAILLTSPRQTEAANTLPTQPSDVIYVAAADPYAAVTGIREKGATVIIVDRFPALIDHALENSTSIGDAYADMAMDLIKTALMDTGRFVTRDAFLDSLQRRQSKSPLRTGATVRLLPSSQIGR
jgi:hypothetical protein